MIIVMGLPGAGKSTVLEVAGRHGWQAINYGTKMFEIAQELYGIENRDQLRGLDAQKQKKVQAKVGEELAKITEDTYVHVSLDTDPNEDEARVRSHLDAYGFDWRFAVADSQMTALLRDAFGLGVLSAPSAPVILVCPDQSAYFLQSGVKSASTLEAEALSQCGGV